MRLDPRHDNVFRPNDGIVAAAFSSGFIVAKRRNSATGNNRGARTKRHTGIGCRNDRYVSRRTAPAQTATIALPLEERRRILFTQQSVI